MPARDPNWSEVDETSRQLRRFVVVGLLCVLTDLTVYGVLSNGLGFSLGWSKAISYLVGVAVGFALNKKWTFQSKQRTWKEPASYFLLYATTLVVNVYCNGLILAWFVDQKALAFFVATGVTTVLNFLGMRLVTFRKGIDERRSSANVQNTTQHAA